MDRVRKEVECCDSLQGFMMFSSVSGGTGSGLGAHILERQAVDYGKKLRMGFNIYPSPKISTSCVEPYNSVLASHSRLEYEDVSVILDN